MNTLVLFIKMLRYRVAVMLLLFFLLGVAMHYRIAYYPIQYLLSLIALASSYVVATTINDIADKKIDLINHSGNKGRPLVTGDASEKDLLIVHWVGICFAVLCAVLLGGMPILIICLSLVINYLYSLKPIRLSYRTYLAPVVLALAYVVLPYWLGVSVSQSYFSKQDWFFITALFALFVGRIILKDFRDRAGDAKYGKPTFVLKYGKHATCAISFVSIIVGNIFLIISLFLPYPFLAIVLELFFIAIYIAGSKLLQAQNHNSEQVSIGIGAKMGNGLLITILGLLVLREYNATLLQQTFFITSITALFVYNFISLIKNPEQAVIGYRG